MALALVRDLRDHRAPVSEEDLADFETDVLAGFVLARASAGLADSTIRNDTGHLQLIRDWFGRPLWEMQPDDADAYFGKVLRDARPSTRTGRAAALTVYFQFLELRHKIELHNLTGRVIECPLDEMNRPRASVGPQLRVPPAEAEVGQLFAGWREELSTCRKFAPAARNYAVARLAADVGLRVNEARMLDLDDVRWELGRFGKLNVRHGKGLAAAGAQAAAGAVDQRRGPRPAVVHRGRVGPVRRRPHPARGPVVSLRAQVPGWLVFAGDRRCVPPVAGRGRRLLPAGLGGQAHPACAAAFLRFPALPRGDEPVRHPGTAGSRLDWHHGPVHPRPRQHVEDAWVAGQQRAADRWKGLAR